MMHEAGVAAIPGAAFGEAGKDFVRFSFASSSEILREAVERIQAVAPAWQGSLAAR
jgi:aspartate aminotransferase